MTHQARCRHPVGDGSREGSIEPADPLGNHDADSGRVIETSLHPGRGRLRIMGFDEVSNCTEVLLDRLSVSTGDPMAIRARAEGPMPTNEVRSDRRCPRRRCVAPQRDRGRGRSVCGACVHRGSAWPSEGRSCPQGLPFLARRFLAPNSWRDGAWVHANWSRLRSGTARPGEAEGS